MTWVWVDRSYNLRTEPVAGFAEDFRVVFRALAEARWAL
jgi:hypothetical protein